MSLCENCGLDLDTGVQYDVVDEPIYDEPPPQVVYDTSPPATVILIGILALAVSLVLAVLALVHLTGIRLLLLIPICLFGVFSAVQFLRGKSLNLMIVSLLLAGGVDLVVLVVLPIVLAEEAEPSALEDGADEAVAPKPAAEHPAGDAEGTEPPAGVKVKALTERIDYTKMTFGIVIFILDALMLFSLSLPGVRSYFERSHYHYDDNDPIAI